MKKFTQRAISILFCFLFFSCAASNSFEKNVENIEIERYGVDLDCSLEVVNCNELVFNLGFRNNLNKTIAVPWFYLNIIDRANDLINGRIHIETEKEEEIFWYGKMASVAVEYFELKDCKIFKPNDEFIFKNIKLKEYFDLEDLEYDYLKVWYFGGLGVSNTICVYKDGTYINEGKMSLGEAFEKQFREPPKTNLSI